MPRLGAPEGLVIRRAGAEDAPLLSSLAARTFLSAYVDDPDQAGVRRYIKTYFTLERLTRQLEDPAFHFFLADLQGSYVGYAVVQLSVPPACVTGPHPVELARIYLEQSAIGTGCGAEMMKACLGLAENLKKETLWLGVWERNLRAREFYRKWGFEDVGWYEFEYCEITYIDPVMARPVRLTG
jgi:GNAT superfamily N-acetyltransferase